MTKRERKGVQMLQALERQNGVELDDDAALTKWRGMSEWTQAQVKHAYMILC